MGQKSQSTKFMGSATADDPTYGYPLRVWEEVDGGRRDRHLQLMIPRELGDMVLQKIHNSPTGGHLGVTKTLDKIWKRFY